MNAQSVLRITELFPNWPFVSLKYSYRCDGEWKFDIPRSHIQVFENGVEVKDYSLWCPDPGDLCPLALALVLDGSESMAGFKNLQAIAAGKHLSSLMNGEKDEASLLWFNQTVTLRVPMTRDTSKLIFALDELPATNLTAAWDATYAGINQVANFTNVPSQCRAVLLLSDGKDNASGRTLESVIAYALAEQVRVFVVAIGDAVNEAGLYALAIRTNGKYFHSPDAIDLSQIFERVYIESRSMHECELFYQSSCPDGTQRNVELRIRDYCGTTVSETRVYTAPLDSSMFAIGQFEVGSVTTNENTVAELPIHVIGLPSIGPFPAGSMTLSFDTTCISFVDVDDTGTLLYGANVRSQHVPGGVRLEWNATEMGQNYGTFMNTYFRSFTTDSSSCCPITVSDFRFVNGCLKPLTGDGTLCYYANPPEVSCTLLLPDSLHWSYEVGDYIPNPFRVTYILRNTGEKIAKNVRYSIGYDSRKATLLQPVTGTQTGSAESLAPAETDTVSWLVQVNPQGKAGALDFCVTAHFDNREDLECCASSLVEKAPSTMLCSIDVPRIVAQTSLERYSPMPFVLTVTVLNSGTEAEDSVVAEIFLPNGLELFGGQSATKLVTARLLPDSVATTSWQLRLNPVTDSLILPVSVRVISANGDTTHCETIVIIPPLAAPILEVYCQVPSYLDLDPYTLDYSPNPFPATLTIKNVGTRPATNISAFLLLPEFVALEGGDTQRKDGLPSTLQPGQETTIQWTLQYTRKLVTDRRLEFRWSAGATTESSIPLDSVQTECDIAVPGVSASLVCDIQAPDTLFVDPDNGLLYPNPVPIRMQVRNTSVVARGLVSVRASIFNSEASFEDGTPAVRILNTLMTPGRVIDLLWYVKIKPTRFEQKVTLVFIVLDAKGIETSCTHTVIVPPSPLYISCTIDASARAFAYQRSTGKYFPDNIVVSAVLRNESEGALTDMPIRLEMDATNAYLDVDPAIPGNSLERLVPSWAKDEQKSFDWVVLPVMKNTSSDPQIIRFHVAYFDPERGWLRTGCTIDIVIEPEIWMENQLTCELSVPDTIRFVDTSYVPEIFTAGVKITNEGQTNATNVQIYLLLDARFSGVGSSLRSVPVIPSGATHAISPEFALRVAPLLQDGYDTLRVLIIADDGLSTTCEVPVYIERQTAPDMFVECVVDVDTIRFDETTNSYIPDELVLTTLIANTGDGIARFVAATALIPAGYQILDSATVSFGTLLHGESRSISWRIRPTCETVGSWDSLRVLVRGVGGLGNRLHIDECAMVLYKEACATPEIALSCSAPDTVWFTSDNGSYHPSPMEVSVTIANNSRFNQQGLHARLNPSNAYTLAPNETIVKPIAEILSGSSATVTWHIIPRSVFVATSVRICADVLLGERVIEQCCTETVLIPQDVSVLRVLCTAPDSIRLHPSRKQYKDVPFSFCADISNNGGTTIADVELRLELSSGLEPLEPRVRTVAGPFAPGGAVPVQCWTINVQTSDIPRQGWVKLVATVDGVTTQCLQYIYVPGVVAGPITCNPFLPDADTLVSERAPVRFPVNVTVTKEESIPWEDVAATISVPAYATLAPGEPFTKPVSPENITSDTATLTWWFDLLPVYRDATLRIAVTLTLEGADASSCDLYAQVKGIQPAARLRIPSDVFASFGRKFSIPVYLAEIDPVFVTEFEIAVEYDASLIHISGYETNGSATNVGWDISSFHPDNVNGIVTLNVKAAGSGGQLPGGSTLCYILAVPVGDERRNELAFYESPLFFITEPESPLTAATAMIASVDGLKRAMDLSTEDGYVFVTGDCILPVNANGGFYALSNAPNPFNPETRIRFTIPEAMDVKVSVVDVFGRKVSVLYDGWAPEGETTLQFNAGSVPAGVYISIMETPFGVLSDKMNLVK